MFKDSVITATSNKSNQYQYTTHRSNCLSQMSLWKNRLMAISNSPQPHSDNSNGADSTTLVGLLKLGCN